jgi:hypothetical protein
VPGQTRQVKASGKDSNCQEGGHGFRTTKIVYREEWSDGHGCVGQKVNDHGTVEDQQIFIATKVFPDVSQRRRIFFSAEDTFLEIETISGAFRFGGLKRDWGIFCLDCHSIFLL